MKTRLAVIWAAIIAAGVTAFGVLTGQRRRRRAEREKAREERRARRAQRKAQGARKRAPSAARAASAGASPVAKSAKAADASTEPASTEATPTEHQASAEQPASGEAEAPARDDLQAIKGLGAVTAGKLRDAGITTYAQIAAWSPEEAQELAGRLGLAPGRIASEDWVGQARRLAEGGGDS